MVLPVLFLSFTQAHGASRMHKYHTVILPIILPGRSIATRETTGGMINSSRKPILAQTWKTTFWRHFSYQRNCAWKCRGWIQRAKFCHQKLYKASVKNGQKKKKKSQSLYPMMVFWILLRKMMKLWLLDLITMITMITMAMLLVTFLESPLRLSK